MTTLGATPSTTTFPATAADVGAPSGSGTSSGTNTGDQTLPTRGSLVLDTTDSPQFAGLNVGAATDTTITRTGAGDIAVEGNGIYRAGGTDVPVADGGTGSSTAAGAATNLGLGTGDSPQFTAVNVGHASDTTLSRSSAGVLQVEANIIRAAGQTFTNSLFLYAATAGADSGTLTTQGTLPNIARVFNLADAATQGCYWSFAVPSDWVSGALTAQAVWGPSATDASSHAVAWSMVTKELAAGIDINAAGTTVAFTGASAARTVRAVVYDTATSTGVTPSAVGTVVILSLRRIGADSADTYVGVVQLLGMIITYTAGQ